MGGRLEWDAPEKHFYETGVNNGVLYPYNTAGATGKKYGPGVAWNGLTTVTESPSGAEETPLYADNIKYLSLRSREDLGLTINAYTYPDEWMECNGEKTVATGAVIGQQARKTFGLCYRTNIGNDVDGDAHGYKLHLVYGCTASPSERGYQTINDSPDAIEFSWEVSTIPIDVDDSGTYKPTAMITIDSRKFVTDAEKAALETLMDALYGTNGSGSDPGTDPYLPLPEDVIDMLTVTP